MYLHISVLWSENVAAIRW